MCDLRLDPTHIGAVHGGAEEAIKVWKYFTASEEYMDDVSHSETPFLKETVHKESVHVAHIRLIKKKGKKIHLGFFCSSTPVCFQWAAVNKQQRLQWYFKIVL